MMEDGERSQLLERIATLETELRDKSEKLRTLEAAYKALDRSSAIWKSDYTALRRRADKLEKELREVKKSS